MNFIWLLSFKKDAKMKKINADNIINTACSVEYINAPKQVIATKENIRFWWVVQAVAKNAKANGEILYKITARPSNKAMIKRIIFFSMKI